MFCGWNLSWIPGVWRGPKFKLTVVMLGLPRVGKTSLLFTAYGRHFSSQRERLGKRGYALMPTIGFNVESMRGFRGVEWLDLWDCSWHLQFNAYLKDEDCGLAFVVDATNEEALLGKARDMFQTVARECARRRLPLCVLANKMDLPDAMSVQRISSALRCAATLSECRAFIVESKMLLLVCLRKGCPREIRRMCLQCLVDLHDGPVVFATRAPEPWHLGHDANEKTPKETIDVALQWLVDRMLER